MEENQENAVFCFARAYRWAKLYYNFKQKAMNEKLGVFQKNTTYKIYYNNLVSCLKGMSEENSKQEYEQQKLENNKFITANYSLDNWTIKLLEIYKKISNIKN